MVVDQQQVVIGGHLQQPGTQQKPGTEIEGGGRFLLQPVPDHLLGITVARSFGRQRQGRRRMHDLQQLLAMQPEGGAQGGMATDQIRQRLGEGLMIQRPPQAPEGGQVIGRETRLKLVQEPEARLGVGSVEGLHQRQSESRSNG